MKIEIIPCKCSRPINPTVSYDGMPQLKVTNYYKKANAQWYEAYCPKCGRGSLKQFKSAYLALKNWNKLQLEIRDMKTWPECK